MSLQPIIPHLGTNKASASSAAGTQGNQSGHTQAEIKRAAMEFEAIMLGQITASMRPETDEEEASLTGGQNDLVQQMFGEQLAGALAKGGGIGVGELLMHELNPNKDKANAVSLIERAAETSRHLRRVESPATTASTATNAATVTPVTADTASVTNITSSPAAQPKDIEPLLAMSRPRRFHEILRTESADEPASGPEYTAVKLNVSPAAENAKPAVTDATSSQPAYKAQTRLDRSADELSQVTRPRRVSELFNAEAPGRTSAVKLPPVSSADIAKLATLNAPTSINIPNSINASASISAPAEATSAASTAKPVYTGQARLDAIIDQAGRRHGVDPHLLAAVMHTESGHRQNVVSNKGASGYMQLMPATFKQFAGPGRSIFDPVTNINAGAAYLKFLNDKYHGNVDKVLAGYNAGIGNVERYGGVPPFRETRNFVASVKKNYHDLMASNHSSAPSLLAASDATPTTKHSGVKATEGGNEALEAFLSQRSQLTARPVSLSQQAVNQTSADSLDLQLPVQGRISSAFGAHRHNRHHQGVDIAAARGTPIEASANGEVVFAGWSQGYGKTVLIKHQEGTYTRYAHADKLMVSRGDTVQMGQQVATVGSTGHSTGPHLHFEILQGNHRVNPLNVVTGNAGGHIEARIGK